MGATVRSIFETGRMPSTVRPPTDNGGRSAPLGGAVAALTGALGAAQQRTSPGVLPLGMGRDPGLALDRLADGRAHDEKRVEQYDDAGQAQEDERSDHQRGEQRGG